MAKKRSTARNSAAQELVDSSQPTVADEQIRILKQANAKLRKKATAQAAGVDMFKNVIAEVYRQPSDLRVIRPKFSQKKSKEMCVVHMTDVHFGKETPTYNTSVCRERLVRMVGAVAEIVQLRRTTAAINHCQLLFGGDFGEGEGIFPGQPWETEVDAVAQFIKEGPEVIASVLLSLLDIFPTMSVKAVPGNHGRQGKFKSQRNNGDSTLYEIVRLMVNAALGKQADRVTWDLPYDRDRGSEWYARWDICGEWAGMLVHGDQIRGQLGFPWYGVGKKLAGWATVRDTCGFHFLFMGHWHTHAKFDLHDRTVLSTGSTESTNAYALENMAAAGQPKQRLVFFNERYGLLSDYPIHLGD